MNKKIRRHSGRDTSRPTIKASKEFIINNCLEPQEYWSNWTDYRDGMRNWYSDRTKLKRFDSTHEFNSKIHKLIKRRSKRQKKHLE